MIKKVVWRIFWILFVILIGVVSIFFIFNSFKSKSRNESKDSNKEFEGNKKEEELEASGSPSDQGFYFSLLKPTLKEPEYQGELIPISSAGINYKKEFINKNLLPGGSAILTSAGDLGKSGIKAITHLATRSIDLKNEELQPRLYITRSIKQAILLAERNGYKSIAFPLADNKFLDLVLPPDMEYGSKTERRQRLAILIMKAVFSQARNCKKLKKIVFVDYGDKVFSNAWDKLSKKKPDNIREVLVVRDNIIESRKSAFREQGITDFSLHKCKVIVNTTFNVEGKFIGSRGVSGFIANQTGSGKTDIQKEIEKNITEFNSRLKNI